MWLAILLSLYVSYTAAGQRPVLRAGSDFVQPHLLHQVQPEYPQLARERHIRGTVIIEIRIGTSGRVTAARIVTGHPLLVNAAQNAVRQWIYQPVLLNGVPVEFVTTVAVSFPPPAVAPPQKAVRE